MIPTARAGALLADLRAERPLVQCVTNFVSMDLTANALLALGARPAMAHAPEEATAFAALAGALVCNIGTLDRERCKSLEAAAAAARAAGKPWVLDPVGAGAAPFRDDLVARLLRFQPTVIRGNASEIISVAHIAGLTSKAATPRGVDTANTTDQALTLAKALAADRGCVVAATGAVDVVADSRRVARLTNGSPLMERVTAIGCALSAATAAFLAITDDPFAATIAAIGLFGLAGELAAAGPAPVGPGTFRVNFIDRLHDISPALLAERIKIET